MIRKTLYSASVGLLFAILPFCYSYSQWSTDPYNNLIVGYGLLPEIASDSAGGCYITYEQNLGYPRRLILERLNRYGYKPWGTGKRILGEFPEQSSAKIVEDGRNGVIISYLDAESDNWTYFKTRLRVQRVDSSGNFLWGPTGVRVSLSETNQGDQAIVSDGTGGCIVAWKDTMEMIRVQRVDNTGGRAWGDSALFLTFSSEKVLLSHSNSVGVTALYYTNREFRSQRINLSGQFLLGNGIRIPTGARVMRSDDQGYIYFFGGKSLGIQNGQALFTLNLMKTDTAGALLWDSLGVTLDTLNTNSFISMHFSLQNGFSTLCWQQQFASQWDLRTQIVRSDGSTVFQYGGIPVSTIVSPKSIVKVLPSDSSTSVFLWFDQRTERGTYAQRLDTLGNIIWYTSDVLVSLPDLTYEKAVTDGSGGFIVVGSREYFSIRAQQVNKYGKLGKVITSIESLSNNLPSEFFLYQNYPNPFNSNTIIKYETPKSDWVKLEVYDIIGQKLKTIVDQFQQPGIYQVMFETNDIASGIYLYKLQTTKSIQIKKLTIIK